MISIWLLREETETKLILITSQNNEITTNSIKAKISKSQENSKCQLFGEKERESERERERESE